MTLEFIISVLQIIAIDIVLSGDNAVVIAMAAHRLPPWQRQRAILWGGGIAIFMRIIFTVLMAVLLMIPLVRFIGGIFLAYIACKLLRDEQEEHVTADNADKSALAAIKMIFLADFIMSLDNMVAVAGASHGNLMLLLFGLAVSIAVIMTCSTLIARLMNRFRWIVFLGTGILAFTAGEMIMGDREIAGWFIRKQQISLNAEWEERFITHVHVHDFDASKIPASMTDVVDFHHGKLTFRGQMSPEQKAALLAAVSNQPADKAEVESMYETARLHPVPDWIPANLHTTVDHWFQMKWPIEEWNAVGDRKYHFVKWIFCILLIGFCLTSPRWWPGPAAPADPHAMPGDPPTSTPPASQPHA